MDTRLEERFGLEPDKWRFAFSDYHREVIEQSLHQREQFIKEHKRPPTPSEAQSLALMAIKNAKAIMKQHGKQHGKEIIITVGGTQEQDAEDCEPLVLV
jgi:hypothetical protein